MPVADDDTMRQAVRAARAHAQAASDLARFVQDLTDLPDPATIAEYAHLLAGEASTLDARTEALRAAGLAVPSLDGDDE